MVKMNEMYLMVFVFDRVFSNKSNQMPLSRSGNQNKSAVSARSATSMDLLYFLQLQKSHFKMKYFLEDEFSFTRIDYELKAHFSSIKQLFHDVFEHY